VILQAEAAVGAKSGLPVTQVIGKLCRDGGVVEEVDVTVTDVAEDGVTHVDIVAVVDRSWDIPVTRAIIRTRLGRLMLSKAVQFDLLVREQGVCGDVAETIWRFGKNVVAVETPVSADRRSQIGA
jgi:hypothetical protein